MIRFMQQWNQKKYEVQNALTILLTNDDYDDNDEDFSAIFVQQQQQQTNQHQNISIQLTNWLVIILKLFFFATTIQCKDV